MELGEPGSVPLRNPRHEAYCQGLASGMEKVEAYEFAGYDSLEQSKGTWKLENLYEEVPPRFQFLMRQSAAALALDTAEIVTVTRDSIARKYNYVYGQAIVGTAAGETKPDLASANSALAGLSKLFGLSVDVQREENFDDELEGKSAEEIYEWAISLIEQFDPNIRKAILEKLDQETLAPVIEIEAATS